MEGEEDTSPHAQPEVFDNCTKTQAKKFRFLALSKCCTFDPGSVNLRSVTPDATFDLRLGSTAASKVSSASHSVPTETHEAKQEENGTLPPLPRSSGLDLGMPSSILYVRNLAPAVVATLAVAPSLPWGIWRHSGGDGAAERPTDEREKKRGRREVRGG